ncbi:MAG: hypothetical protein ACJ8M1_06785 [Chthoniobacterales bacterium]
MKNRTFTVTVILLITAVALAPMSFARIHTTEVVGTGHLIVWRSPGLGNDLIVRVLIDGRKAADVTYGGHFETNITAGRHVIGVQAFPQIFPGPPWNVEINVRPGELFNFTAKGSISQLILKRT